MAWQRQPEWTLGMSTRTPLVSQPLPTPFCHSACPRHMHPCLESCYAAVQLSLPHRVVHPFSMPCRVLPCPCLELALPSHALPCPYPPMPSLALPCPAPALCCPLMPCPALLCPAPARAALPCPALPSPVLPFPAPPLWSPFHALPYPYPVLPLHTLPCHPALP